MLIEDAHNKLDKITGKTPQQPSKHFIGKIIVKFVRRLVRGFSGKIPHKLLTRSLHTFSRKIIRKSVMTSIQGFTGKIMRKMLTSCSRDFLDILWRNMQEIEEPTQAEKSAHAMLMLVFAWVLMVPVGGLAAMLGIDKGLHSWLPVVPTLDYWEAFWVMTLVYIARFVVFTRWESR